jgi:hypothetical protein
MSYLDFLVADFENQIREAHFGSFPQLAAKVQIERWQILIRIGNVVTNFEANNSDVVREKAAWIEATEIKALAIKQSAVIGVVKIVLAN